MALHTPAISMLSGKTVLVQRLGKLHKHWKLWRNEMASPILKYSGNLRLDALIVRRFEVGSQA